MMRLIVAVLILTGCTTTGKQPMIGEPVSGPYGAAIYCAEHPDDYKFR